RTRKLLSTSKTHMHVPIPTINKYIQTCKHKYTLFHCLSPCFFCLLHTHTHTHTNTHTHTHTHTRARTQTSALASVLEIHIPSLNNMIPGKQGRQIGTHSFSYLENEYLSNYSIL